MEKTENVERHVIDDPRAFSWLWSPYRPIDFRLSLRVFRLYPEHKIQTHMCAKKVDPCYILLCWVYVKSYFAF